MKRALPSCCPHVCALVRGWIVTNAAPASCAASRFSSKRLVSENPERIFTLTGRPPPYSRAAAAIADTH
eukprot:331358-Chlamydomonas_euryale.AAC.1